MNTYLLGLISKWAGVICLSITGLFNSNIPIEKKEIDNLNQTKKAVNVATTIEYETKINYNDKLPKDTKVVKQEGKNGIAYKTSDKTLKIIEDKVDEIIEIGTGEKATYVGKMTGYGADCDGCTGILSCKTKEENYWNLNTNGEIYQDDQYGKVRILAAALDKFPCGTIIEVKNPNLNIFTAIVLDTGSAMKKSLQNGIVHMDLAFEKETSNGIYQTTSSNVEYNVKRWGW